MSKETQKEKKHTKIQTNPDHGQGQRDGPQTTVEGETRFSRTRAQSALSDPNVPGWVAFCVAFLCLVCPFFASVTLSFRRYYLTHCFMTECDNFVSIVLLGAKKTHTLTYTHTYLEHPRTIGKVDAHGK